MLKELNELKRKISVASKRNFQLEGDISVLDKKIALLIKNRTTLEVLNNWLCLSLTCLTGCAKS